jgi:biopolymer transport protein TolQ
MSVISWAAIFRKVFAIKRVRAHNEDFEREFWSGTNLSELYSAAAQSARHGGPMERIFASGMREYQKLRERRITDTRHPAGRRTPRHARQLPARGGCAGDQPVLPGHGRFGGALCRPVWHRLGHHARLHRSGLHGQVTLASVAPGIAEALVATAIGLFAAIPAVVAYNRFAHDIDRLAIHMETFMEEFSNILQRNLGAPPAPAH